MTSDPPKESLNGAEAVTIRLKQLEFIQGIISRLAQNSFFMKSGATALTTGLLGFAAKDADVTYAALAAAPAAILWILDGHYLSMERQYRALYQKEAADLIPVPTLTLPNGKGKQCSPWLAPSVCLLYLALIFACAGILLRNHLIAAH